MRNLYKILTIFGFLIFFASNSNAQDSKLETFFKLPRPEKCWVVSHPFKAKKAFVISKEAQHKADSIKTTTALDGDSNGGQVDAFRHTYWMAILAKQIGIRASIKLGKKHEKGNYIYYKRHKTEDGTIPDKISTTMDLKNNEVGIELYINKPEKSKKEIELLIINKIKAGEMYIIKKNEKGEFLDCKGNVIHKEELKGKWKNNKCLIYSNGRTIISPI